MTKKELIQKLSDTNIPDNCDIHIDVLDREEFVDIIESHFSDHRPDGSCHYVLTIE
jgi:hypothetical protein